MGKLFSKAVRMFFLFWIVSCFFPRGVSALGFTLIDPEGPFSRGQEVKVTVMINAQGETLTSVSVDLKYDTSFLEYRGVEAGDFFPTVTDTPLGSGLVRVTGTVGSGGAGKTGQGTFAYLIFKIAYDASGSTEFCSIVNIPSPAPSATPIPRTSSSPYPTGSPGVPLPTGTIVLPPTGNQGSLLILSLLGIGFWLLSGFFLRLAKA